MNRSPILRGAAWFLLIQVLLTAMIVPVGAVETRNVRQNNIQVMEKVDMEAVQPYLSVLEDFERDYSELNWLALTGTDNIRYVDSSRWQEAESILQGNRVMLAMGSESRPNVSRKISLSFLEGMERSGWNGMFFALYVPYVAVGKNMVKVELVDGDNKIHTWETSVEADVWNGICLNLTELSDSAVIMEIRISVRNSTYSNNPVRLSYYLDCLGMTTEANLAAAVNLLSGSYSPDAGTITMLDSPDGPAMQLDFQPHIGKQFSMQTPNLPVELFAGANSIRIRLENQSASSAMICEFNAGGREGYGEFSPQSFTLNARPGVQTYTIPLPAQNIERVRITFLEIDSGSCIVHSIMPYQSYSPLSLANADQAADGGNLNRCLIDEDDKTVLISGSFTEEGLKKYRDSTLEAYVLSPEETVLDLLLRESSPLAEVVLNQGEFTLSLPLYDDQQHSRLSSAFVVLLNRNGYRYLVDSPVYITNPESAGLSQASWTYPSIISKKGMITHAAMALETNLTHTVVPVDLAKLFSTAAEYAYSYEGQSYSFSEAYILQLDRILTDYLVADVNVTLSLRLTLPNDGALIELLVSPGAVVGESDREYAFNVSDQAGVNALRAACDFLAKRYMSDDRQYGRAVGIICGRGIDRAEDGYCAGEMTLREYVEQYSRMFRIVYNTVRSISPRAAVYIGLGNSWDGVLSHRKASVYPGRDVLEMFSRQIREEGEIPWRLVLDPYDENSGCMTDWTSAGVQSTNVQGTNVQGTNAPGKTLSFSSLGALCTQLRQEVFLYQGTQRGILLVNDTPCHAPQISPDRWTAEYIAAYYAVSTDACSAVQSLVLYDQSQINGRNPGMISVMKVLDTSASEQACAVYRETLGISSWSDILPDYKNGAVSVRQFVEGHLSEMLPGGMAGSADVWKFSEETLNDWMISSSGMSKVYRESHQGYAELMQASFGQTNANGICAVTSALNYSHDLTIAPYLSFRVYAENLPEDARDLVLTLTVVADGAVYRADSSFSGENWHRMVCDLSEFSGAKNVRKIILQLRAENGVPLNGTGLYLGKITAYSLKHDSAFLEEKFQQDRNKFLTSEQTGINDRLAWILIGVIVCAATLEILYVLSRVRVKEVRQVKYDIDEDMFR